ncbi:MAG: hypothetical protein WCO52_05990 [bacterium]
MPITVFHSLTATTPDITQYEIRPSHWNSGHAASINAVGSEISGAFSNGGNVTFGLSANGFITASAPSGGGGNLTISGGTSSASSGSIVFANSNGVSFGLSNGTMTASYTVPTVPTSYVSQVNGSSGAISLNVGSSLSASTNGSSITFGLASNITTALQSAGAYLTTTPVQTTQPVAVSGSNGSFAFSTLSMGASNGLTFYTTNGSIVGSYTVPAVGGAQTAISGIGAGTQTQTSGTVLFSNSGPGNIAFGLSNGTITASFTGAYLTTAMQSQSSSVFAKTGFTSASTAGAAIVATLDTNGLNMGVPAYLTTTPVQTTQPVAVSGSNGSFAFSTLSMGASNGLTFYTTNGSIVGSYTVPAVGGAQTGISSVAVGGATYTSGSINFINSNSFSFLSTTGQGIIGSFSVPATSSISGTGAVSISVNGSTISIGAPAVSMGVSGGNTSNTSGTVSNQLVFAGGNNITLSGVTGAGGMTVTISGANAAGAQTGISGISAGTQLQTAGTLQFVNSNGMTFGMSNSSQITVSYTVPAVPTAYVSSVNGSSGAISLNVGSSLSASTNGSSITFGLASNITTALQSAGAYLTTAMQSQSSSVFAKTGFTSASTAGSLIVATLDTNGLNMGIPAYLTAAAGAQTGISAIGAGTQTQTSGTVLFSNSGPGNIAFGLSNGTITASFTGAYLTTAMQSQSSSVFAKTGFTSASTAGSLIVATLDTNGLNMGLPVYITTTPATSSIVGTGIVSVVGAGNTISIGAPAVSMGVSGGNTSNTSGTVSNQLVFAGGNNITLSGVTGAGGMTVTISGANAAGAQTGISGISAGTQLQTAGTLQFVNSNGMTFGMSNSSQITVSYTVPAVPTAYVSSVNGSSGAISLNVGSSLSASTNGSSITFGLASNITTALQSAGAYLTTAQPVGAYLTTAAQSSASNVSLAIAATNNTGGGTASLSGAVSFSNANGLTFYTSLGNAIVGSYTVPTVPTAYVSSVNGSSGAISLNVGSSLSASTNGSSITFGLASNITTALQSAGAYLTTAPSTAGLISAINISGSNASANVTQVVFVNSNNMSFGLSTAGLGPIGTITASFSQSNQTGNVYVTANSTQLSSSAAIDFRSLSFAGAGVASVGVSGGVVLISVPSGGGGGGVAIAASNSTFTSGTVVLAAAGGALTISNGIQSALFSVPATSSISGTGAVSISVNGSTISIGAPTPTTMQDYLPWQLGNSTYTSFGQNTLAFMPMFPMGNYSMSIVEFMMSLSNASSSISHAVSNTLSYAMYSQGTGASTSQMLLMVSSSMAIIHSYSSNLSAGYTIAQGANSTTYSSAGTGSVSAWTGQKIASLPFATSIAEGGLYYFGLANSTASVGNTGAIRISYMANAEASLTGFGGLAPNGVTATNASILHEPFGFIYSATSGAWPSTMPLSDMRGAVANAYPYVFFEN